MMPCEPLAKLSGSGEGDNGLLGHKFGARGASRRIALIMRRLVRRLQDGPSKGEGEPRFNRDGRHGRDVGPGGKRKRDASFPSDIASFASFAVQSFPDWNGQDV